MQRLTSLALLAAAVEGAVPTVELRNAAVPGTRYPMTGLGLAGPGFEIGQREECWHYPTCCTRDYCPIVNATRDWLAMGGAP